MPPSEPDDLQRLGERIEEAARRRTPPASLHPSAFGIAARFGWEMVGALVVGGGLGWGIDWAFDHWSRFHTRPWGIVVMFVLGAIAGIRNVMRAASEINARTAKEK